MRILNEIPQNQAGLAHRRRRLVWPFWCVCEVNGLQIEDFSDLTHWSPRARLSYTRRVCLRNPTLNLESGKDHLFEGTFLARRSISEQKAILRSYRNISRSTGQFSGLTKEFCEMICEIIFSVTLVQTPQNLRLTQGFRRISADESRKFEINLNLAVDLDKTRVDLFKSRDQRWDHLLSYPCPRKR